MYFLKDLTYKPLVHLFSNPDVDQPRNTSKDQLHVPNGPMTRSKTKALKEALKGVQHNLIWAMDMDIMLQSVQTRES